MIVLSPEQKAAVEATDKRLCILACAGSGKTTTLTARIARLVNDLHVDPSCIAAITFTVLAADKLKYQIAQRVTDKSAPSKMFVGTIHSFCLQLLASERIMTAEAFEPITESQQFILMSKNWHEWGLDGVAPGMHRTTLIERLLVTFDIIKMNAVDQKALEVHYPELTRVFGLYQGFLADGGYVDYADMLVQFRDRLLRDDEFRSSVLGTYSYLFVDEYQDVDPVQAGIVEIFGGSSSVCVVGDDDQAIYQFRGTDERNIQLFSDNPGCRTLPLSTNRRSPTNILHVAQRTIAAVDKRLAKDMRATCGTGLVEARRFATIAEEIGFIVDTIESYMADGRASSYGQFALLLRSMTSYGELYVSALRDAGIPYVARGARSLFATQEVGMLVSVVEWLAKDSDSVDDLQLLQPIVSASADLARLQGQAPASSQLAKTQLLEAGCSERDCIVLEQLHLLRARYESGRYGSLLELIHIAIAALRLMSPDFDDSVHYNVGLFTQIVADYEGIQGNRSFRSLAAFLASYASRAYDEAAPLDRLVTAVNVLTVHQAKGLEFDFVFLPMLVQGRFPLEGSSSRWLIDDSLFDSDRYHTTLDNETRLFYVACTRPRKALYLLASEDVGLKREKKPSSFFIQVAEADLPEANEEPDRPSHIPETERYLVTGYSALEYYLTCPYRYQLIVEFGAESPRAVYFQFGKLIHDVLAHINLSRIADSPISVDQALGYIEENFTRYYKTTSMREYDVRSQKVRAKRIVRDYVTSRRSWIDAVSDAERDFAYVADDALVRGRYDALLRNDRGRYSVLDYKTGHPHAGLRTDFQMQFYALAANEQLGIEVDEAILCYVEEDTPVVFEVSDNFLEDGRTNLRRTIAGILDQEFDPTPRKDLCRQCEVRRLCVHRA